MDILEKSPLAKEQLLFLYQTEFEVTASVVRPEKWDDSEVGFRGSNASDGELCFYQAHFGRTASEMATLGASLLLCILRCCGA